jgi:hypothetical protein
MRILSLVVIVLVVDRTENNGTAAEEIAATIAALIEQREPRSLAAIG